MAFPLHSHDPLWYELGAFHPLKGESDLNKSLVGTFPFTHHVSIMKLIGVMTLKKIMYYVYSENQTELQ